MLLGIKNTIISFIPKIERDYYQLISFFPIFLTIGILIGTNYSGYFAILVICLLTPFFIIKRIPFIYKCFSFAILLGITLIYFNYHKNIDNNYLIKDKYFKKASGRVEAANEFLNGSQRILVENIDNINGKISLYYRGKKKIPISVGDKIIFSGYINPSLPPSIPYGYDSSMINFFYGIIGNGYITGDLEVISHDNCWYCVINKWREVLYKKIKDNIENSDTSELITAILIGKKDKFSKEMKDKFRFSGLSHLIAISGLHVSVIAFIISFILRRLIVILLGKHITPFNGKTIASLFTIPILGFYVIFAGNSPSVQRAFMMTSLFLLANCLNRHSDTTRALSFSATAMIIINPMNIFLPSFQMSFSAVLGLISFNINKKYIGIFFSSFIATVFSLPFVAYNFNYCSISGIIANFIAIPLVTILILPLSLLWLIVINTPYSFFISKILEFLINNCLFNIANIFSKFTSLHFINMPNSVLLVFTISLAILGFFKSRVRYFGIVIAIINSIFWYKYELPDIFISDKNIAIKVDKQLYFTSKRTSRLKRTWLNAIGADEDKILLMKNSSYINIKENQYNKSKFISFKQDNKEYSISFNLRDGYHIYGNNVKINFDKNIKVSICFIWLNRKEYHCNKNFAFK